MWYEVAIISIIFAVGNILFGHFEEKTPKWRRFLKFLLFMLLSLAISHYAGRSWFHVFLGIMMLAAIIIHAWWLPKNGIHPLTGEPRDRYYEFRGWKKD